MAKPRLEAVTLLANAGAAVRYRSSAGTSGRFVRPDGLLSVPEAAALLGTNRVRVLRMGAAGRLKLRPGAGLRVSLAECRALLRLGKGDRALAMYTGAPR